MNEITPYHYWFCFYSDWVPFYRLTDFHSFPVVVYHSVAVYHLVEFNYAVETD